MMKKKFGLSVGHVVLKGFDGSDHANGKLPIDMLVKSKLLSHNGRIYMIDPDDCGRGISVYKEVPPPYHITEF